MRFRWSRFRPYVIAGLSLVVLLILTVVAINWMEARAGHTQEVYIAVPRFIGSAIALSAVTLLGLVWALTGRERIDVRGDTFRYQRFVGPFRTLDVRMNLLEMHGLRCDLLIAPPDLRHEYAPPPPCPSGETPAPLDVAIGAPMAVWYGEDPFKFGFSFEPHEWPQVAQTLLAHDAALRQRVGLDPGQGLSDRGIWTQPRTLALGTAAGTRFTGPLYNRSSDFNK